MILVITGHFGSGKTLLRGVCNSHPEFEITDAFYSFYRLNVSWIDHIKGLRKKTWYEHPIVGELETPKLKSYFQNGIFLTRYLFSLLAYRRKVVHAENIQKILRGIFSDASVVGDTGHRYILHSLDQLVDIPEIKIVIVYRDCRDVAGQMAYRRKFVSSWANDPWTKQNLGTSDLVAKFWLHTSELMDKYANQIHMISYEDLVTNPEAVTTQLSALLNVDPKGFNHQIVHTKDIGNYKQWLSDDEIATILKIAGPTMERLGYTI